MTPRSDSFSSSSSSPPSASSSCSSFDIYSYQPAKFVRVDAASLDSASVEALFKEHSVDNVLGLIVDQSAVATYPSDVWNIQKLNGLQYAVSSSYTCDLRDTVRCIYFRYPDFLMPNGSCRLPSSRKVMQSFSTTYRLWACGQSFPAHNPRLQVVRSFTSSRSLPLSSLLCRIPSAKVSCLAVTAYPGISQPLRIGTGFGALGISLPCA